MRLQAIGRPCFRHIRLPAPLCTLKFLLVQGFDMALPPLQHPAWLMVATIGSLGAALTSWMGGSVLLPIALLLLAAVFALLLAVRFKRMRRP